MLSLRLRKLTNLSIISHFQGRLKKYCLLALLSLTLVVFLKYAENQSPLQFSYTGGHLYFADDNNDIDGQITHRENIRLNKSYAA